MELEQAEEIIGRLYSQVSGHAIAHAEKKRMGREEDSTTYGEVKPASLQMLLSQVSPREGESFIDLGSGMGQPTLVAAMLFPFRRLVGVELLTGLGDAARQALSRYDAEIRPQLPELHQRQSIEFLDGDLLEADISGVDVVFAQAPCFEAGLMAKLAAKLETLKSGARLILVGQQLASPSFTLLTMKVMRANWGTSLTWLYQHK
ncbi:SAM-dependent methyltransferase [Hyalangium versicolor]|uniref:SAM-dependent methyltransferase n=1 Tax=Hyalangium versicolor TaxID=2861190 RepID=UPI001CCACDB2|nr:SAM-dependent methyltransferase [Hyalangium versicolor]